MIFFSLTDNTFAAHAEKSIIILDVQNDAYLSLINDAASHLEHILSIPFVLKSGTYEPAKELPVSTETINHWIDEFKKKGFIEESTTSKLRAISPAAPIEGGLREYQWDTKVDWKPFKTSGLINAFKALITLRRVNRAIKKGGMKDLFNLIRRSPLKKPKKAASVETISAIVDAATKLYLKKTFCLGWAATFVIEARKRGIPCTLQIGVQTNPFYAHAWAQLTDGTVVHDDPQVKEVLTIIATLPE